MDLVQLNPFPRYIGRHLIARANAEHSVCYDCRLFYLLSGSGSIQINHVTEIILKKDNALFLPPATVYQFRPSDNDPLSFLVFNFDLVDCFCLQRSSLGTAFESTFNPERVQITPAPDLFKSFLIYNNARSIQKNLCLAEEAVIENSSDWPPIVSAFLKLSLVKMASNILQTSESIVVNEACAYIRQNYTQELSNLEIASQFHYHPNHLNKIMKDTLGITIRQYLINHRINMAKSILVSTNQPISEVAWSVGFPSSAYFVKVFHRIVGKTPKQYRTDTQINNY